MTILIHFFLFSLLLFILIPSKKVYFLRLLTLVLTIVFFIIALGLWLKFNLQTYSFQNFIILVSFTENIPSLGLDGFSLLFILLTTFSFPLCILATWQFSASVWPKLLLGHLLLLEIILILFFSTIDLFYFFVFFELILIPTITLIGIWGSRANKMKAIYYFFLYTFFGSLSMLCGLILLYYEFGTTNMITLYCDNTLALWKLKIIWILFFIPFAIKIPMLPFHLWLLEAHVEAPTIGSVILAGLLLKFGSYGFIRILLMLFYSGVSYYTPLVITLALSSTIYASLTILRQIDIKRIIAYSSIAHMNYGLLGLFSETLEGFEGGFYLMLNHGFSSSALFFLVGMLYDRFHSRFLDDYGGLAGIMPLFSIFFFFFSLANFGFPGTGNFVGEFLIFIGYLQQTLSGVSFVGIGFLCSLIYSMLLYNRLNCGEVNILALHFNYYPDLSRREFFILLPLVFAIIVSGLFPVIFLPIISSTINMVDEVINIVN